MPKQHFDIAVIGAGAGGLSIAAVAAQLNLKVALIESHKMGGDCLNYGCVPSKALIAAGKAHHDASIHATTFGVTTTKVKVDFNKVHEHVHSVISTIAPNDSEERFTELGATVIRGKGEFTNRHTFTINGTAIQARYFVVAAGSRAATPPIKGLETVPYLTNETIFDLTTLPKKLLVIGGGPIGCELGQAYQRLGAMVTILDGGPIMPKDDAELVEVVRQQLVQDGITLHENISVDQVTKTKAGVSVTITNAGKQLTIEGTHLLIAAGRAPNVNNLGLEKAGVAFSKRGIEVDKRLRTANKRIYAIGDCIGPYQFTHMASYQAGIAIRNMIFKLPAKVNYQAVPWCTYTSPPLAHVGMTDKEAAAHKVKTLSWPFSENDRAIAERNTTGFVKVFTSTKGKILGVSIVGEGAGDLIQPWVIAIEQGLKISALANYIAPYPTRGEINKRVAGQFYTEKLFSTFTKKLARFLMRF